MAGIGKTAVVCFLISFCFAQLCLSDEKTSELSFIMSNNPINEIKIKQENHSHFGIHSIFTGSIRFYQLFISTQDKPVCNFTPSCSQFGINAINEFGVIKGILLTSDRLQRCNGMSAPYYTLNYKTGKFIDPTQFYANLTKKQK